MCKCQVTLHKEAGCFKVSVIPEGTALGAPGAQ